MEPRSTVRHRWVIHIVFGLSLVAIVAAIVIFNQWIEKRFPRPAETDLQETPSEPLAGALNLEVERTWRSQAEARYMQNGLTLAETIARFLDDSVDLTKRRVLAYRLAREGTPEALAALRSVLQTAPPEHRAFLAQLIGSTGNPQVKELLVPLLDDANSQVVVAAITGLGAIGGEDVTGRLEIILSTGSNTESVRGAAALALGTIGTPDARRVLVEAFGQVPSDDLAEQILKSLGRFEFSTIAGTFREYLAAPETPADLRTVAVEALANSSLQAVPFLVTLAEKDPDSDVRASAAWAISTHHGVNDLAPSLTALAERETDPDVRRRLYEALLPQAYIPAERLLPLVRSEKDIAARVAGYNAVGLAVHQQPASPIAALFDRDMVPELQRIATSPNSLNIQMRAVFALRRAQTPAARAALTAIAGSARPQVATAARNGLRTTHS